jgi:uncharacterized protein (TIGR00297 family)
VRGHWAAFVLGTLVVAAGWAWGGLLVAYFVTSSALTRFGHARKQERTESMLAAPSARNAWQVMANGGLFGLLIVLGEFTGDTRLLVAGLGALSAAAADTWATEIGTLWGGAPRSILTGGVVAPGASGGVTAAGSLASVVAAALMAAAAHWTFVLSGLDGSPALAVLVGGIGGSLGDSVLGATLQSKRWCEQCRTWTERKVHVCQYRTRHASGLRWMNNDTVNLLATAIGAALAILTVVTFSSR